MNRQRGNILLTLAVFAGVAVVLVVAGRNRAAVVPAESYGIPNQWRWQIHRVPVQSATCHVQLAVRHQKFPMMAGHRIETRMVPLTPKGSDEHVLALELLPAGATYSGVVSIDLLDLRLFGEPRMAELSPLRAGVTLKSEWTISSANYPIQGHSVRNWPVMHEAAWEQGECNLLTLTTVDKDAMHVYTFYLALRPQYQ